MPIYRYRCTQCGAHEEHLQKVSDPPRESCEACGGSLAKQMTAAAFHLKGGGWYKDLYSSSKAGADAAPKSDSGGASTGDSASSSSAAANSSSSNSSGTSSSSSAPSTPASSSTSTPSAA